MVSVPKAESGGSCGSLWGIRERRIRRVRIFNECRDGLRDCRGIATVDLDLEMGDVKAPEERLQRALIFGDLADGQFVLARMNTLRRVEEEKRHIGFTHQPTRDFDCQYLRARSVVEAQIDQAVIDVAIDDCGLSQAGCIRNAARDTAGITHLIVCCDQPSAQRRGQHPPQPSFPAGSAVPFTLGRARDRSLVGTMVER